MTRSKTASQLQRLLNRAAHDSDFRAHVVEDGRAAQTEHGLSNAEWEVLFNEVERIEAALVEDPFEATEVDHGEADAAGAKG